MLRSSAIGLRGEHGFQSDQAQPSGSGIVGREVCGKAGRFGVAVATGADETIICGAGTGSAIETIICADLWALRRQLGEQ
jgi:hypothetical protein